MNILLPIITYVHVPPFEFLFLYLYFVAVLFLRCNKAGSWFLIRIPSARNNFNIWINSALKTVTCKVGGNAVHSHRKKISTAGVFRFRGNVMQVGRQSVTVDDARGLERREGCIRGIDSDTAHQTHWAASRVHRSLAFFWSDFSEWQMTVTMDCELSFRYNLKSIDVLDVSITAL